LASQLASKGYFAGEAAGLRLANREGITPSALYQSALIMAHVGQDKLEKLPPHSAPSAEIHALQTKMALTMEEIRGKNSILTVQDLKRLLFRCAATLISLERVSDCSRSSCHPFSSFLKCDYELLHYLVALPCGVSTPPALAAGIEAWIWVIAEKPDIEVALLTEVLSSWFETIRLQKGIFSNSME
jgi:phosphatidylinositol 4-kinase A